MDTLKQVGNLTSYDDLLFKGNKKQKNKNFWETYLLRSKFTETGNKVSILFGLSN